MKRVPTESSTQPMRCRFVWCTTEHGRTVHPDDEMHRSAGAGFAARVRDGSVRGSGVLTDVEVGVIRRDDDDESWVALEFGAGSSVSIDLAAARTLGRLLREDPDLLAAFNEDQGSFSAVRASCDRDGQHG